MRPMFCFLLLLSLVVPGCDSGIKDDAAMMEIFIKEKKLNCQLASMRDSITSEWDNIGQMLKVSLPMDVPTEEKANMVNVRNANLIRMFQSFEQLDEEIKAALRRTEQLDVEMTRRIKELKKEIQKIDSQRMDLYQKLDDGHNADLVAHLKGVHESVLSQNCE